MTSSNSASTKRRVFSGMQPSGEAHLGNYLGALRRWVDMQDEYDCVWCIVDDHAITGGGDPAELASNVIDLAVSFLAVGLDPERSIIFVQSDVHEHTELAWLFNAVTPVGELERMTQFKDKSQRFESIPAGILNYPILQAADVLLYKADAVPVGEDQRQHLELTREIARKFNAAYGETFPETEAIIEKDVGRIMGLDGEAKMSKSLGNTVAILSEPEQVWDRVRTAVTDPQRVRRTDPGRPEVCNVFSLHGFFTDADARADIDAKCRSAEIGCVDCKRILSDNIVTAFEPFRERAAHFRANPAAVRRILDDGAEKARSIAKTTMAEVRQKMGMDWRSSID
ncbi:MAG: tryptophan--tRNA ligase [Gemmatimonadetes bacterium]|nr:tryptophan--tRNA ligase [Gemmatimonadota bacterium]MDA1103069.1 tryptophan--tRNA ligase [Gemmatimonadota bacterium]